MKYRHLGRLGLKVSPLCLGTMNFGPQTSETNSHAIMDRALATPNATARSTRPPPPGFPRRPARLGRGWSTGTWVVSG